MRSQDLCFLLIVAYHRIIDLWLAYPGTCSLVTAKKQFLYYSLINDSFIDFVFILINDNFIDLIRMIRPLKNIIVSRPAGLKI